MRGGRLADHGNLPPEDAAVLRAALDAMHDRLFERQARSGGGSAEPELPPTGSASAGAPISLDRGSAEPHEARRTTNADALVAMADAALSTASGDASRPSGAKHEIVVHVDAATLSRGEPGRCRVADKAAIAPETARRLACEGSVVPVIEAQGSTLSVGRRTRKIPPALERAVRNRDGGCRFPGCENRRFGEIHHIVHLARGGETRINNLAWLCRRHHRLIHEGGFSLERAHGGALLFRNKLGAPIADSPDLPVGSAAALDSGARGPVAGTPASGAGEPLDLDHTIDVLAARPWATAPY